MRYNESNDAIFAFEYNNESNLVFDSNADYYFNLTCIIAPNVFEKSNLFYNYSKLDNININFFNYYAPNYNESLDFPGISIERAEDDTCYTITPTKIFTESDYFTKSDAFSFTNSFTQTDAFSLSSIFTVSTLYTPVFSHSSVFPASKAFTSSNAFTLSGAFTYSSSFTDSFFKTGSNTFTKSDTFFYSFQYQTKISNPQKTEYNMGASDKDRSKKKTDQGLVLLYVCLALLIVLLIVVITFAICKTQKPVPEKPEEPDIHDEFFFPDFENLEENNV